LEWNEIWGHKYAWFQSSSPFSTGLHRIMFPLKIQEKFHTDSSRHEITQKCCVEHMREQWKGLKFKVFVIISWIV
jgi:hypothetical protein